MICDFGSRSFEISVWQSVNRDRLRIEKSNGWRPRYRSYRPPGSNLALNRSLLLQLLLDWSSSYPDRRAVIFLDRGQKIGQLELLHPYIRAVHSRSGSLDVHKVSILEGYAAYWLVDLSTERLAKLNTYWLTFLLSVRHGTTGERSDRRGQLGRRHGPAKAYCA